MKKNIISITLIIMLVLVATSCGIHVKVNNDVQSENKTTHDVEYKEEVTNTLTIKINDKEFVINLENNKTALEFAEMLPLSLSMTELNGNEKYVYLDETLTTDSYNPVSTSFCFLSTLIVLYKYAFALNTSPYIIYDIKNNIDDIITIVFEILVQEYL